MNPLARVRSIKLKIGIVIVAAVAASATMSQVGYQLGWREWRRPVVAVVVALVMAQLLARGLTSPLREMARKATAMARGDHVEPVRTSSRDEVGQLAHAFNSMAAEIAEVDRERRDLIANAAHELRTPITGLQATIENLADGVTAPTPEVLQRLRSQVDRLGALVHDLLDLSRLEAADFTLDRRSIAVRSVVDDALAQLGPGDGTMAPILVDIDPSLTVSADPVRLGQVVTNLVRNAFVHGGGESVQVCARRHGDTMALTVSDCGPGLAGVEAERMFERFYRGGASRAGDRSGAGIGLSIVHRIVEQHGGTITAEPNEPHGCRMVVTLPVGVAPPGTRARI